MRRALPLVLLAAAACGRGEPAQRDGRAYYQALNCKACHRIGAEAGRGAGPDLTLVGFRHSKEWLDAWLKEPQAWRKGTLMPNPRLSPAARAAVVDYLAGLKGEPYAGDKAPWDKPELSKDSVQRGRVIFAKAGCVACHGRGGAGGFPNNNVQGGKIPPLHNVFETYTKDELTKKIANGVTPEKADPAGPDPLIRMPAWSKFLDASEIGAVADYLMTLRPAGGESGSGW